MKKSEPLIFVATSDLSGVTRGKAFPLSKLSSRCKKGVGWVPTNVMITCFDTIGPSPFGSLGDLLLTPDTNTEVNISFDETSPSEHFMLGDITELTGEPWDFCTRSILKTALNRLKKCAGVTLMGAFEHEFQFLGESFSGPQGFSIGGFSKQRAFGESLIYALAKGGVEPDTFMKEFGDNQYEITNVPSHDVKIADDAVKLREISRMTATQHQENITFTPIRDL
jgi:glutamine synthetase